MQVRYPVRDTGTGPIGHEFQQVGGKFARIARASAPHSPYFRPAHCRSPLCVTLLFVPLFRTARSYLTFVPKFRTVRLVEIDYERRAFKYLSKIPPPDQQRVTDRIATLEDDPRPAGSVKLEGMRNAWRIRQGDYRIVYWIDDAAGIVTITKIGQRGDVYGA